MRRACQTLCQGRQWEQERRFYRLVERLRAERIPNPDSREQRLVCISIECYVDLFRDRKAFRITLRMPDYVDLQRKWVTHTKISFAACCKCFLLTSIQAGSAAYSCGRVDIQTVSQQLRLRAISMFQILCELYRAEHMPVGGNWKRTLEYTPPATTS
jgi:hypothetical protein